MSRPARFVLCLAQIGSHAPAFLQGARSVDEMPEIMAESVKARFSFFPTLLCSCFTLQATQRLPKTVEALETHFIIARLRFASKRVGCKLLG